MTALLTSSSASEGEEQAGGPPWASNYEAAVHAYKRKGGEQTDNQD